LQAIVTIATAEKRFHVSSEEEIGKLLTDKDRVNTQKVTLLFVKCFREQDLQTFKTHIHNNKEIQDQNPREKTFWQIRNITLTFLPSFMNQDKVFFKFSNFLHFFRNACTKSGSLRFLRVITKLPNSEQSYKGKVKTHNYINRQNQSTTGKL
jgi:hypothetical protein